MQPAAHADSKGMVHAGKTTDVIDVVNVEDFRNQDEEDVPADQVRCFATTV